ncbi:hypothetical protein DQ04_01891020 [Trypanosoma grayi]|uniref:hypothetical protein n=1 Tax=Trypanosoma grayi TaxID=71804 RepID=UPI0004F4293A|nr:hypothetical protein DQ04_01891020 [Trypanosoma grayi]KEG12213.1 hypothetical protein DQ04_01891020 [Trypanosoma grayi]
MSRSAPPMQAQPADVVFESRRGGTQRVAVYPIEFGASSATLVQQLEKHSGIDFKHQQACQQHYYTGEVVRADSSHNCGSSSNLFIPHGTGTLVYLLYAKGAANSSAKSSKVSVGLPPSLVSSEYGDLDDLRGDTVLITFTIYKGTFSYGRRQGQGRLTVYPRYTLDCAWDDDAPILDRTPCVLRFLAKFSTAPDNSTADRNMLRRTSAASRGDADPSVTNQYVGMTSLISSGVTPHRGSFAGLAWAEQVRFVPDGVGEMLYPNGIRHCGCWQCGQRHGFGVEYDPGSSTVYMGGFVYDHREGAGTLHYCSTGMLLCGNWKEGKLADTANAVLPTWPFTLQGALWKSYENWTFGHGTLVHSCGSLSGVWEPLFVAFDEMLSSVAGMQQDASTGAATTASEEAAHDVHDYSEANSFLPLLSFMMQREEFMAVLVPFQRCFYFLYKPCDGKGWRRDGESISSEMKEEKMEQQVSPLHQSSHVRLSSPRTGGIAISRAPLLATCDDGPLPRQSPLGSYHNRLLSPRRKQQQQQQQQQHSEVESKESLSPFLAQLRALGRDSRRGGASPLERNCSCPSWCNEVGVGGNCGGDRSLGDDIGCFHTERVAEGLATRMPLTNMFERAMHDLASFVSSVRLRLLSYVAAHPAACDVSVSKNVLAVCWDSVYSLVAPVVYELAAAAEAEAAAATTLALQRCVALRRGDFVPAVASAECYSTEKAEKQQQLSGEEEEEEEVKMRCARLFASPAIHFRRVEEQTTHGRLLRFGPHVGSRNDIPAVYASPADMFGAVAAMWRHARRHSPRSSLMQERWMSNAIVSAFANAAGCGPCDGLSPVAVLRVLRFLACDVSPHYPFPSGKSDECTETGSSSRDARSMGEHSSRSGATHYSRHNNNSNNKKDDTCAGDAKDGVADVEGVSGTFTTSFSTSRGVVEVLSVLTAASDGLERLRHVYPTIRFSVLHSHADKGASNGDGDDCNKMGVVYPLDELAVRTRFVLFAAVQFVQQHCRSKQDEQGENDGNMNNGEAAVTEPTENDSAMTTAQCIQWVLRLPLRDMQQALREHVEERRSDVLPVQDENRGVVAADQQQQQQHLSAPSSEVLSWVLECIGDVLESSHYPATPKKCVAPRAASRQQQQQQDASLLGSSVNEQNADAVSPMAAPLKPYLGDPVSVATADPATNSGEGTRYLSYQWTHFLPIVISASNRRAIIPSAETCDGNTNSFTSSEAAGAAAKQGAPELLTENESLQFSLLQRHLADLGILVDMHMRFCYDNEEDGMIPTPLRGTMGTTPSQEAGAAFGMGLSAPAIPTEAARCVGKEATLSFQVDLAFCGTRAWELLADVWISVLLASRVGSAAAQHTRRKCVRTDVLESVN